MRQIERKMVSTVLLLGFLLAATVTDIRRHKIYNWTTYPGIVIAITLNGLASLTEHQELAASDLYGLIGFTDSIIGFLGCGFGMLVCYVFFPGGVGGGDVKLVAMMGAFLGPFLGLESMLWTFVLGGGFAIIVLVWRFGVLTLLARAGQVIYLTLRFRTFPQLTDEERKPLKTEVFLAPSALAAVLIVHFQLVNGM